MRVELCLTNKLTMKAISGLVQFARYTSALITLRYSTFRLIISSFFSSDRVRLLTMHITSMTLMCQVYANSCILLVLVLYVSNFNGMVGCLLKDYHFSFFFFFPISIPLVLSCFLDKGFIHFREWFRTSRMRLMIFHQKLIILFSHKKI